MVPFPAKLCATVMWGGLDLLLYNTSWCSLVSTGNYAHTLDDFTILGCICEAAPESTCILVQADSPFQTMEDLVTYAQAHPRELICGGQINSRGHFVEILVEDALDYTTTYVDAGSNADTITALLGGNIDMCCITTPGGAPYVESGDLRALAINGADKSLLMPDVPRLVDMGYEAIDLPMVHFLFGPKGMAEADINAISKMLEQTLNDTELVKKFETAGNYMMYLTPEESEELMKTVQSDFDKAYGIIQTLQK